MGQAEKRQAAGQAKKRSATAMEEIKKFLHLKGCDILLKSYRIQLFPFANV